MQDAPPQGSIADLFLPRLIARLHRDGFEGAVRVTSDPHTRVIYFRKGEIASAASNAEADRLANILIQDGRLTGEQLGLAKARVPAGGSLGKTLIEMGFLTPGELLQGARRQVREILSACFSLSAGSYQVEPGPLPPEVTVLGLSTRRLIFDCLAQSRDRGVVVREMGSMESVYGPTEATAAGLNALKLDIEMDRIGRSLDGTLSLRDLSGRTSLDDFTVSKVVLAFELLGLAQRFGEPPEAQPAGRTITVASGVPQEEPETVSVGDAEDDGEVIVIEDEPVDMAVPHHAAPAPAPVEAAPEAGAETPDGPYGGESAGETPPVPPDELPAFALPPDAAPQWQIDAATGERVHVGPIELTFDGQIPGRRGGGGRVRHLTSIAALGMVILGGAAYYLIARRGGEVAGTGRHPEQAETVARAAPAGPEEAPAPERAPAPEPAPAPALVREMPAEPPASEEPPPPPAAAPPPRTVRPVEEPPPGPPPHGSVSPFGKASRYVAALRHFDEGDAGKAARIFAELAAAEAPDRYTLQLMIACEVETLRKARARSGEEGSLFFVPFVLGGRDCYRACWGNYPDIASAQAATAGLPPALTAGGLRPIVISLGRLRPSS